MLGVNFGRVGFLSSMGRDDLERGLERALSGDYVTAALPTIEVGVAESTFVGVNDAVVTSAQLGRMVEIGCAVGGEDIGSVPCDGIVCSTPSGSTAYNLSNGGPVLMWGLGAMALTYVAPHSLHARPLVVPRGCDVEVRNVTAAVACAVLVDGHMVGEAGPGACVTIRLGERRSLLASLPGGHVRAASARASRPSLVPRSGTVVAIRRSARPPRPRPCDRLPHDASGRLVGRRPGRPRGSSAAAASPPGTGDLVEQNRMPERWADTERRPPPLSPLLRPRLEPRGEGRVPASRPPEWTGWPFSPVVSGAPRL